MKRCGEINGAYCKEDPLKLDTIVVRFGGDIETKLVVLVVMLLQIEEDCSSLEDDEIVPGSIYENGDTSVWVQLNEPWFFLDVLADIYLLHSAYPREVSDPFILVASGG